jgi:GNAT superfamily N-acetyltransferase
MRIRTEEEKDRAAVYAVNAAAFETPLEAKLVDALRQRAHPAISLVAEDAETVVGHIMFSPVSLTGHAEMKIVGLGPMAVAPNQQRKGIASALVRAGLEVCRQLGFGAVIAFWNRLRIRSARGSIYGSRTATWLFERRIRHDSVSCGVSGGGSDVKTRMTDHLRLTSLRWASTWSLPALSIWPRSCL